MFLRRVNLEATVSTRCALRPSCGMTLFSAVAARATESGICFWFVVVLSVAHSRIQSLTPGEHVYWQSEGSRVAARGLWRSRRLVGVVTCTTSPRPCTNVSGYRVLSLVNQSICGRWWQWCRLTVFRTGGVVPNRRRVISEEVLAYAIGGLLLLWLQM